MIIVLGIMSARELVNVIKVTIHGTTYAKLFKMAHNETLHIKRYLKGYLIFINYDFNQIFLIPKYQPKIFNQTTSTKNYKFYHTNFLMKILTKNCVYRTILVFNTPTTIICMITIICMTIFTCFSKITYYVYFMAQIYLLIIITYVMTLKLLCDLLN